MASATRSWIVAMVTLTGIGVAAGAASFLTVERERLRGPQPVTLVPTEGEACDRGSWAVVIRDGERRLCLDAAQVLALPRLAPPFAYECAPGPQPTPAPAEPPALEPDPGAAPLVSRNPAKLLTDRGRL